MAFSSLSEWLSWQESLHPNAIDLGLDRLRRTLERLQWRRPACPIITVGGTNGKGSTVAMLTRILGEAGYRVGTFTSPHLADYNERIVIGGKQVSDASLIAAFERIDVARGTDTLTFFEFNTLAALLIFETAGLDAMVLEVGMGGRLDAVNIVDADLALITSVGLDHCEWLGTTVEAIGREKAGIFRPGKPAILGAREMPASVQEVATQLGSEALQLGRDFEQQRAGDHWTWRGRRTQYEALPPPSLAGEIQFDNAANVLAALECLSDRLPVTRERIVAGLRDTHLIGRFQVLGSGPRWILDVAHNPAAARVLAMHLRSSRGAGRTYAVCSMLGDKDIAGVAAELRDCFDGWITAPLGGPRAIASDVLAQRLRDAGVHVIAQADDVAAACAVAQQYVAAQDRVVVFGSFLTVAPALQWLRGHGVASR